MKQKLIIGFAIVIALGSAVSIGLLFLTKPALDRWPFHSSRTVVRQLLGMEPAPWFERAEVLAWAPDPDSKPLKYFIAGAATAADYKYWAGSIKLNASPAAAVPDGVMVLPAGINFKRFDWLPEKSLIGAQGDLPGATVWARWSDGAVWIVVVPEYK